MVTGTADIICSQLRETSTEFVAKNKGISFVTDGRGGASLYFSYTERGEVNKIEIDPAGRFLSSNTDDILEKSSCITANPYNIEPYKYVYDENGEQMFFSSAINNDLTYL